MRRDTAVSARQVYFTSYMCYGDRNCIDLSAGQTRRREREGGREEGDTQIRKVRVREGREDPCDNLTLVLFNISTNFVRFDLFSR